MKNYSKSEEVAALRKVQQILKPFLETGQSYLSEVFEPDAFERMAQNLEQDFCVLNFPDVNQHIAELREQLSRVQAECSEKEACCEEMKQELESLRETHSSHEKFRQAILRTALCNGDESMLSHFSETDRISMKLRLGMPLQEREAETVRSFFREAHLLP
jgi:DNA-binding SARP family transcriptional activator